MKNFDTKHNIIRYRWISCGFLLLGLAIIFTALRIMTVERKVWIDLSETLKKDSVPLRPERGRILGCNGEVLASSLPQYKIYMDFLAGDPETRDSVWEANVDSICSGLHRIFPELTKEQFRKKLDEGRRSKRKRSFPLWPNRIDYNTYLAVKSLPVFCLSRYKGGFYCEEYNARIHPFDMLASRTIGDLFGAKDSARCGIELAYDSLLRGKPGWNKRRKVMNKFVDIPEKEAENGADVVTTIDVLVQDLAEKAILEKAKEINAYMGVAIVMECSTGDIKALVNLGKGTDGIYREARNYAISDRNEPGSVFKTASLLVALDDGVCDTAKIIETNNGVEPMHGAIMKDHNWRTGGYGTISLARALEVSSNIGISKVIDEYYKNDPQKFVDGLHRIGIAEDLHLPFAGSTKPVILGVKERNWWKTTLPWMSIGYESQVPPISIVSFYNAIANNGVMMQPRFVTKIQKDGEVIKEYPPIVLRNKICGEKALNYIQTVLTHVVSQGLGKKAGSSLFQVAGKTGTAQISNGMQGYKGSGATNYLVSFAGYFPADKPLYSCIVCFKKAGLPASGGSQCGPVFKTIAEGVMSKILKRDIMDAKSKNEDNNTTAVKAGGGRKTQLVANTLDFKSIKQPKKKKYKQDLMPDVLGMGARDAVCTLERRGLKVKISGKGSVFTQTIPAGKKIHRGMVCHLEMK